MTVDSVNKKPLIVPALDIQAVDAECGSFVAKMSNKAKNLLLRPTLQSKPASSATLKASVIRLLFTGQANACVYLAWLHIGMLLGQRLLVACQM